MEISIKNIKYSAFASEDSHCFQASVYIDNKPVFVASNDGQGGANRYEAHNKGIPKKMIFKKIEEIDSELRKEKCAPPFHDLERNLEITIGELMNEWHTTNHIKKILKKVSIILKSGDLLTFNISAKSFKEDQKKLSEIILEKNEGAIILNSLTTQEALNAIKSKSNYLS